MKQPAKIDMPVNKKQKNKEKNKTKQKKKTKRNQYSQLNRLIFFAVLVISENISIE